MLIEHDILFVDNSVVVVVPEQPVVELVAAANFFQEFRQFVRLEIGVDLLLNRRRCAVRNDVIDLPVQPLQRLPGFRVFFAGRKFLLPP